jgi:hypothetical protein
MPGSVRRVVHDFNCFAGVALPPPPSNVPIPSVPLVPSLANAATVVEKRLPASPAAAPPPSPAHVSVQHKSLVAISGHRPLLPNRSTTIRSIQTPHIKHCLCLSVEV